MSLPNFSNQLIRETYQRLLQRDDDGTVKDGTGSIFIPPSVHISEESPQSIPTGSLWYSGSLYVYTNTGSSNEWVYAGGIVGTSGTSGVDGVNGTSGSSGIDGTSGSSGIDGTFGSSGTSGLSPTGDFRASFLLMGA